MSSQNPPLLSFLISRVYWKITFGATYTPAPYRDDIVYGLPLYESKISLVKLVSTTVLNIKKMKLPPIKVIVIDILYWTCVAIGMILAVTIVFFYAWKAKQVSSNFMIGSFAWRISIWQILWLISKIPLSKIPTAKLMYQSKSAFLVLFFHFTVF